MRRLLYGFEPQFSCVQALIAVLASWASVVLSDCHEFEDSVRRPRGVQDHHTFMLGPRKQKLAPIARQMKPKFISKSDEIP